MADIYPHMNETKKIFRFISFFDLYEMLVNRRLRFSKLSTFPDKNEGLGHIIKFQDHQIFRAGLLSKDSILNSHRHVLNNHYLSCWTEESDMIAMWALYSPDILSIRVSTTVGKLFSVVKQFNDSLSWTNFVDDVGTRRMLSWLCALQPVEYVDFFELRDKVRIKYQEFERYLASRCRQDKSYLERVDGFKKDYDEFHNNNVTDDDGLFLKDKSYAHEHEVRAVLYCGVRNNLTVEEWRRSKDPIKMLFEGAIDDELPDYIYAPIDPAFIETICFDPRMPHYKRRIFENLFADSLPQVEESKAFGYALEQESFASDYDGHPTDT